MYEVLPKQLSAYFSWSESFESNPGYLNAGGTQVAPEEGEQYEFGAKADLFHGKLSNTTAWTSTPRPARSRVGTSSRPTATSTRG